MSSSSAVAAATSRSRQFTRIRRDRISWCLARGEPLTAAIIVGLLVGGCQGTSATPSKTPSLPARTSHAATTADSARSHAVAQAHTQLQGFLHTWEVSGYPAAAKANLAMDDRAATGPFPKLISGNVVEAKISSWQSAKSFTLITILDLHFQGDADAWANGSNTRFVSAHRTNASAPFRFHLATGP